MAGRSLYLLKLRCGDVVQGAGCCMWKVHNCSDRKAPINKSKEFSKRSNSSNKTY